MGTYTVLTATSDYGLNAKKELISQVAEIIDDKSFEIKQDDSICHQYEGWRQLFIAYANKRPDRSFSDASLGWYYPAEISNKPVMFTVILGDKRVPPNFDASKSQIISSGGFSAYIFKNY